LRYFMLALLLVGCGGGMAQTVPVTQSLTAPQGDPDTRLTLTLVNGYTTATPFFQQATCGKPFPFNVGNGVLLGPTSPYGISMTTAQAAPLCSGAKINKFRYPTGDLTRIMAGPVKQEYVCAVYVTRRKHGNYIFKLGWPRGVYTDCTVVQDTPTHATFTWNLKYGAPSPPDYTRDLSGGE